MTGQTSVARETATAAPPWPRFRDIPEPRMVALCTANGSGTKVYQSFLDGHPEIYMVPVYQLLYLYPHWEQWTEELKDQWSWASIIDAFCLKHASLLDSRRIPTFDGLTTLGGNRDEYLAIDERTFRACLIHLLEDEAISARTFLLAVHYAYTLAQHEGLRHKRVLVYHIHVTDYVRRYLEPDFPDMLVLGTVRDPRANIRGRHRSNTTADFAKLNYTDAVVFQPRAYYFTLRYMLDGLDGLAGFDLNRIRVVRHEDLHLKPAEVMQSTARFLGIEEHPCLGTLTFGGRLWWGTEIYDIRPMNQVNPKIVSRDWKKRIGRVDWFVFEGLMFHYMRRYGYQPVKYTRDSVLERALLLAALLLPAQIEREEFSNLVRPRRIWEFVNACVKEAFETTPLKDYTFNAYYRHKWTHSDLNLWRRPWYVQWLVTSRQGVARRPESRVARFHMRAAQAAYVLVNLCRFGWAVLCYPARIVRRWRLSFAAFNRSVRRSNLLPATLP